jgi:hypothetical protein
VVMDCDYISQIVSSNFHYFVTYSLRILAFSFWQIWNCLLSKATVIMLVHTCILKLETSKNLQFML